ncbi:hypothetical protein [Chryseobacterium indologenes]|uniref:Uncharacterized protein n=1 Tax=Chryseobacterium indologenes TaxID=253 RepID=A0A0N0ZVQ6_CHRID|nr:hypothetical protein [Chryseobacterium indologenes]KPE50310.1 hypothetical protein AOB46_14825 [Chryseobacterium indologenes]
MNLICSIFLTFYMVFRPLIPLTEYAVNYDYISKVLCINKSRPEVHCNGKCYLSKQLAKTNDTDSSPLNKTKTSGQKIPDTYIPSGITTVTITEKIPFLNFSFIYEEAYSFLFLKHIFKPPVFLSFIFYLSY